MQIFALDTVLDLPHGASRAQLAIAVTDIEPETGGEDESIDTSERSRQQSGIETDPIDEVVERKACLRIGVRSRP